MRVSSITKNAGKACNNRLYRHIRTFEKIIKNYFVIYHTSENELERRRSKSIVKNIILPGIDGMLHAMDEMYGPEARRTLEKIIKENK